MQSLSRRVWHRMTKPIYLASTAMKADAFLVSYPKSGRTWFRFVLANYFAHAFNLGTDVDLHSMFRILPNFDGDPVRGIPAFASQKFPRQLPLIPVSHLAFRRRLFLNRPAIIMVRDPRDVIVSSYFHATRQKHSFQGDIDQFIADRQRGIPALVRYLNGWAKGAAGRRTHVLSYERLTAATAAETAKVLSFLGVKIRTGDLEKAVEAGRFSAMKEQELSIGLPAHEYDRSDAESLRMRRGQVGGFADYLDARQVRMIDATCSRELTPQAKQLLAGTGIELGRAETQRHRPVLVDGQPKWASEADRPRHDAGPDTSFPAMVRTKLSVRLGPTDD
jgi:hypothetical protein